MSRIIYFQYLTYCSYNCTASFFWHYLSTMATMIPAALTFFAVFIIVSVSGDTSECTLSHSNIEILSQFIDARINAAVNARVTAATVEEEFNAAVDDRIAAVVNTTFSALTASVDERIRAVNTTISALNVKAGRSIHQPGEVAVRHVSINLFNNLSLYKIYSDRDTVLCSG